MKPQDVAFALLMSGLAGAAFGNVCAYLITGALVL